MGENEIVIGSPEGEYGEILNIQPKRKPEVGDIEDKIVIINPTGKLKK